MKRTIYILTILIFCLSVFYLNSIVATAPRGGIGFTFANAQLETINSNMYYSFDIQASALGTGDRPSLGTGMILLNYNTDVFGEWVNSTNSVIVTRGMLLTTSPFPFYNLIVNDNQSGRLAVTFEYMVTSGWGNLMEFYPMQLLNIKLKISSGGFVGLSFAQAPMTGQQYQDDNATLFSPVIAVDTDNTLIPSPSIPTNLSLSIENNVLSLTWQGVPGYTYKVYSASNPGSENWQTEATGITQTTWSQPVQASKRFFYVTSQNNIQRR